MKNDAARLAELFSLARKKDVYGALALRLSETRPAAQRDISSYAATLKKPDSDTNVDRDMLHYSYGL